MSIRLIYFFLFLSFSIGANAGWLDKVGDKFGDAIDDTSDNIGDAIDDTSDNIGDAIDDTSDNIGEAIDYTVEKELGLVAVRQYFRFLDENLWQKIGFGIDDEHEDGFGEDELLAGIMDFYVESMDNSNLTIEAIEGNQRFTWVPIFSDVLTFIPVYPKNTPAEPSAEEIWFGIDSDEDGIYDDVEHFAVRNFENDEFRLAIYRYAHSIKQAVENKSDSARLKTAIVNAARAENCMNGMTDIERLAVFSATVSTMERLKGYWEMSYKTGDLLISLNKLNELACK